jgi:predicted carbohydrate-binding protein with CBM5 and CBM33 domain
MKIFRRPQMSLRRKAGIAAVAVFAAAGITVLTPVVASAHGASTSPGSRTYLCYQDGHTTGGDLVPKNAACSKAVADGGTQPLWDWFGVLRSDGAGRTTGFIPDGELCSGGATKYDAYNEPRNDWPATRLTSGANWAVHYNAWAAHPGQFRLYITKDGYDPTKPLAWSDLESEPFSTWDETVPNGSGEYYWNAKLPTKTGRHIIYSVWSRTDSKETFYGCSDVVFDGGNGQVIGIPGYDGQPVGSDPTESSSPTPSTNPGTDSGACTAQVDVTNSWSGGFQGSVTVLNKGAALTPWTVTFTVPSGVSVTSGWNADFSSSGNTVTAKAPSHSQTIASGAQVSLGFVANGPSTPAPSNVKLNGSSCGGTGSQTDPPTTTAVVDPPSSTVPVTSSPVNTGPPGCSTGAQICDGFEQMTAGSPPSGGWSVVSPDCSGSGKAVVDSSVKHNGSASLRVDGVAGYCNHVFVQASARLDTTNPLFVRTYVRHSTLLPAGHTTFIAMTDLNDGGKDLRIGGQNKALQWNRSSDDATLPEQSPVGVSKSVPLPIGDWQCLEYKIDGAAGTAQTWLNGTLIEGLNADGTKTQDVDGQWYNKTWRPSISNLKLGWESYGEGSDTLWYDDVAVGSTRIGC